MSTIQCPHCNEYKRTDWILCELCGEPVCSNCSVTERCLYPITDTEECKNDYHICPECAGDYICPVHVTVEVKIVQIIDDGSIVVVRVEDTTTHWTVCIYFDRRCFFQFLEGESDEDGTVDFNKKVYHYNQKDGSLSPI